MINKITEIFFLEKILIKGGIFCPPFLIFIGELNVSNKDILTFFYSCFNLVLLIRYKQTRV